MLVDIPTISHCTLIIKHINYVIYLFWFCDSEETLNFTSLSNSLELDAFIYRRLFNRWNVVGVQGALLAYFIEPVYFYSIVLGSLFHATHMLRAVAGRIEVAIILSLLHSIFRISLMSDLFPGHYELSGCYFAVVLMWKMSAQSWTCLISSRLAVCVQRAGIQLSCPALCACRTWQDMRGQLEEKR